MLRPLKTWLRRRLPAPAWLRLLDTWVGLRYAATLVANRGDQVECPLCGGRFRRFLPNRTDIKVTGERNVAGGGFEQALCPRCDCSNRERLVYLYLREKTDILATPRRLLHVAPERNLQRHLQSVRGSTYVTADLEWPLAGLRMDVTALGFRHDSFDAVICNHVLEHVPDDRQALAELHRVLRPGGWAILQVPISLTSKRTLEDPAVILPGDRERLFGHDSHVRIYGQDYRDRLEQAGFSPYVYSFSSEYGLEAARHYGLQPEEGLYVCYKS